MSRRAKVEGEEGIYEDHLSYLEDLQGQACEVLEEQDEALQYVQRLERRRLRKICYKVSIEGLCYEQSVHVVTLATE
jgi:hypothetical protein